jgi:hypothetical protein
VYYVRKKGGAGVDKSGGALTNGYQLEHVKLAMCWPRAARLIGGTISNVKEILRLFGTRAVSNSNRRETLRAGLKRWSSGGVLVEGKINREGDF